MREAWTADRVRQLLQRVQPYSRQYPRGLLGAMLGKLLRQLEPDFRTSVLGDSSLGKLVARFPDIGTVRRIDGPDFVFEFAKAESAPSSEPRQEVHPWRVDRWARDFWMALAAMPKEHVATFVDLQTTQLVVVLDTLGQMPKDIVSEPERFLRIPCVPDDQLLDVATRFIAGLSIELQPMADRLRQAIKQTPWRADFESIVREAGLSAQWKKQFQESVTAHGREWKRRHGLPENAFLAPATKALPRTTISRPPPSVSATVAETSATSEPPPSDVREIVVEAVGYMSDAELMSLAIPIRCVLAAQGRLNGRKANLASKG